MSHGVDRDLPPGLRRAAPHAAGGCIGLGALGTGCRRVSGTSLDRFGAHGSTGAELSCYDRLSVAAEGGGTHVAGDHCRKPRCPAPRLGGSPGARLPPGPPLTHHVIMRDYPRVLCVFGTRPEAIKMAPVVRALAARSSGFFAVVCVTDQHRGMLDRALEFFDVRPDPRLGVMRKTQPPRGVAARVLARLPAVLEKVLPSAVLVQGDTTTT